MALALLGVVVVGFFYLKYPKEISQLLDEFDRYGDTHLLFLTLVLFSVGTNVIWAYTVFCERLGINQQGKRLEILTGRRRKTQPVDFGGILKIGSLLFAAAYLSLSSRWLDPLPTFLPGSWHRPLSVAVSLNFGLCGGIVGAVLSKTKWALIFRKKDEIPPMPCLTNGIVLGTVGEEENGLG